MYFHACNSMKSLKSKPKQSLDSSTISFLQKSKIHYLQSLLGERFKKKKVINFLWLSTSCNVVQSLNIWSCSKDDGVAGVDVAFGGDDLHLSWPFFDENFLAACLLLYYFFCPFEMKLGKEEWKLLDPFQRMTLIKIDEDRGTKLRISIWLLQNLND